MFERVHVVVVVPVNVASREFQSLLNSKGHTRISHNHITTFAKRRNNTAHNGKSLTVHDGRILSEKRSHRCLKPDMLVADSIKTRRRAASYAILVEHLFGLLLEFRLVQHACEIKGCKVHNTPGGCACHPRGLDHRVCRRMAYNHGDRVKFIFFFGIKWRTKGLRLKFIDKIINFLAR